ncbi:hypothetical protein [Kibdelosporangium phytohabitans]|uniref:PH domain-containing protein n=1 Tax=Kibdelosporangium phytohabitans TaxID=860235 RepID=A0A0N9HTM8_9PSEU|nr:hypothetical protein [Kibdelosporangium phytohabitans]ALG08341.1 hypothetical protein AOZ06_16755 [Kibdelosporangium phytohabitans]MBE1470626.1 hypothetical protein [Kibdelosporangium phytohabitans]
MNTHYRIPCLFEGRRFGALWLGILLAFGIAFLFGALGVLLDQMWIAAIGTAVLVGGPPAVIRRYKRANTILLLHSKGLGIGQWTVDWNDVEQLVLHDNPGEEGSGDAMVIGVRLRTRRAVPAGMGTDYLDQTTPSRPVILLEVPRRRVHEELMAETLKEIAPRRVTLTRQTENADTSPVDRR